MTTLPQTTREVRLATVPAGVPEPHDLAVAVGDVPVADGGSALVRTTGFLVTPALIATLASGRVPGMTLRPGDVLPGPAVGEVLTAPDGAPVRAGDLVRHPGGWREHAVVPVGELTRIDPAALPPEAHLSQGWPAYVALTRVAPVQSGDTVLVTGGAGALGSLAGQVARLLGAGRVVGTTGSAGKADRMVAELGYDAVVVRGPGLRERLADAAPPVRFATFTATGRLPWPGARGT